MRRGIHFRAGVMPSNPEPNTAYAEPDLGDAARVMAEAAARIQAIETSLAEAEGRVKALMIALHDAVRRPMGVVPESAEPFYLPSVADQVRLRLASDSLLDRQGKEGV